MYLENVIGVKNLADRPTPLRAENMMRPSVGLPGLEGKRKRHGRLTGRTYIEKLFIVDMKFQFNSELCILSSTLSPVIIFFPIHWPKNYLNTGYDWILK